MTMTSDKDHLEIETSPFLATKPYQETTKVQREYNNDHDGGKDISDDDDDKSDETCGFWIFKSDSLQRFASENMYMILYGIAGSIISMAFAYYNGTITTLEKRYKIPTKTTGIITVGNDISSTVASLFLGYYAGRGHRPRWIGLGLLTLIVFCLLMILPHILYGSGEEALELTVEYGANYVNSLNNSGTGIHGSRALCNTLETPCEKEESHWIPIILLFLGQLISGIGCALFYVLGISYMDDNTTKSKTPALLSWSSFLRMLGPAVGYSLSSVCLRFYINPTLQPIIKNTDSRWLGAWWTGWFFLAFCFFIAALVMFMFPKELPSAKARRIKQEKENPSDIPATELSMTDMWRSLKRLGGNKVFIYNTLASILYFFGYTPYWIFTPKYIETQFRQSAATASMVTGTVALGFSATGILLSGYLISKYKPSARTLAAWNGIVDILTVVGIVGYVAIGCQESDNIGIRSPSSTSNCSLSCHCDYVHYSPICGADNITYISACHAGCTDQYKDDFGHTIYSGCGCITSSDIAYNSQNPQVAMDGACPVDCFQQFLIFLGVMCFLKLVGASGRSSNLLLTLRCIPPEDKSLALGLGSTIISLVTFIPSPIFFGWLLDSFCLVWGKTCSNKGNCWLYDTKAMRYKLNLISAAFIFVGAFWNIGVWYHAKDLKIFDDKPAIKQQQLQQDVDPEKFEMAETKQHSSVT